MRLMKLRVNSLLLASVITISLVGYSCFYYSLAGPPIATEILMEFRLVLVNSILKLSFYVFSICFFFLFVGGHFVSGLSVLMGFEIGKFIGVSLRLLFLGFFSLFFLLDMLIYNPAGIVASFNYDISRLYPIWVFLSPGVMKMAWLTLCGFILLVGVGAICKLFYNLEYKKLARYVFSSICILAVFIVSNYQLEPAKKLSSERGKPNLILIGSDSLRADKLGFYGYKKHPDISPSIDKLARQGTSFMQMYVPLARTAPSLTSILTSTWPHQHKIRTNFFLPEEANIATSLPKVLEKHGYNTMAVGDWAATDLSKLPFGFKETKVPSDQWNLKFLISQGPKDLRLFLSIFLNNNFGKWLLPEIYYLAGKPVTSDVMHDGLVAIGEMAQQEKPFFMMIFMATTHAPFGSEYPYYHMYSDPSYKGKTKFSMTGLSTPKEIVDSQQREKAAFDIKQIHALYDGAVRQFDDQVKLLVSYLEKTGIADNTLIGVFSDHGVDLFEKDGWGQGNLISNSSYRIPFILFDPRDRNASKVKHITSSLDISPTLLGALDISKPEEMEGIIQGRKQQKVRPVFAETGLWLGKVKGLPKQRIMYPVITKVLHVPDPRTGTLAVQDRYMDKIINAKGRAVFQGGRSVFLLPVEDGVMLQMFKDGTKLERCIRDCKTFELLTKRLKQWIEDDSKLKWCGNSIQLSHGKCVQH